ncbi:MAG: UDP-glucose/GDP-mannose dehydrogenase family protein [Chloroflexi bacterium]|nr:UDP-glucose/GDP-mannose dehydrogenase family protein [Chloroflexota bacterium]
MADICIVGAGHVGLVTGACFADLGNEVTCLDVNAAKIAGLQQGKLPIYEPGLEELVERNAAGGRLRFTSSYPEALERAEFAFIAVDTPSGSEGEADLSAVRRAARAVAEAMTHDLIIVNKSTVPIGTGDVVSNIFARHVRSDVRFWVVSNPEFLREGSAVQDCLQPDRVVLGGTDRAAAERVATLYEPLRCPIIITDLRTAEMIKYASNAFLATRISFINEIAAICDQLGADVKEVARGMGYDKRIGPGFLEAGLGWGGSCFPKDVRALSHMAAVHGTHPGLLRAVMEINQDARRRMVHKLRAVLEGLDERVIAVLGLSFKPNTDDVRDSPAIELARLLQHEGAIVRAYDPVASENAGALLRNVALCASAYEAAEGADAVVVATDWNEFKQLDLRRLRRVMRQPVIVDGRNVYDPAAMRALGFVYVGVGRGNHAVPPETRPPQREQPATP